MLLAPGKDVLSSRQSLSLKYWPWIRWQENTVLRVEGQGEEGDSLHRSREGPFPLLFILHLSSHQTPPPQTFLQYQSLRTRPLKYFLQPQRFPLPYYCNYYYHTPRVMLTALTQARHHHRVPTRPTVLAASLTSPACTPAHHCPGTVLEFEVMGFSSFNTVEFQELFLHISRICSWEISHWIKLSVFF